MVLREVGLLHNVLRCDLPACMLAGLLLVFCMANAAHAREAMADTSAVWRVVLIRSWDSLYPINILREMALRDALLDDAARIVEFFPEEIDTLRFPGMMDAEFALPLQRKYRDTPIDLVIASGIEPLQFAARHRDAVWPGAAVVFNGVFDGELADWRRPPRTTGVTLPLDVAGALALGRSLVPGARHVYVVSGSSPVDRTLRRLAAAKLTESAGTLEVHHLAELTRAQAGSRVSSLGADAFVLYLTMLRDANGQLSGPGAPALMQVAASSSVPVVSPIQTQVGRGVAGASSPRYDVHGRTAGIIARRVLEGGDPNAMEIRAEPQPTCEVDWKALTRWQVAERNIPAGCVVVNRALDPLRAYAWQIVAVAAIIVLQAALLSALAVQSRRRRLAETRLRARNAEMAQDSRIAMVGALTANIAHEINQPIGAILNNADAAQMMLDQGTLTDEKLREILADIRSDDMRAGEVIRTLRRLFAKSQWKAEALEVNVEVAEALRHVEPEAAEQNVRLTPVFGADIPAVLGDATQLQQVVTNLVVNAIEAVASMPGYRREVRIVTRANGTGVEIAVADEGPGLDAQGAAQLFDSTFTTKRQSMGFGLSIVRGIIEMHHGRVWFEPNVPRGAVFRTWLPAIGA